MDKKALKAQLYALSTPEERESLGLLENETLAERLVSLGDKLDEVIATSEGSEVTDQMKALNVSLRNFKNSFGSFLGQLAESQKATNDLLAKGFKELSKPSKQQDFSGFFKDFPTLLSQIGGNTKDTSDLIRNLKWNASQQLRDVNGSPINPAIAGFGITSTYDDIKLTNYDGSGNVGTVTYYQNGNIKAQLSLTYDGSGNLIDATRVV